jgi:poly(hydroxyalkanoate) depolymerase family esterase
LVLPEQAEENNRGRCFNWFVPRETARGGGEALSIRQMVGAAIQRFGSDPRRVFIAGLSAGGAMTAALLAAYPDVFAAGAVVAGLPVGAAASVSEALRRMAEAGPDRSAAEWADQVRRIAPASYRGTWPRISIWRGTADRVVDPTNAQLIATQWAALHGLEGTQPEMMDLAGALCDRWSTASGPVVELWRLPGIGHEWPHGATHSIAKFWKIAD